ncbi:MAG TPA: VWA domain-containing protein [Acidimicrobiales bacterium]|nr:VWA domain-containing protein [Acidimicrobiales bacterium]
MTDFPFGAVVGQEEAKLALVLAAAEPAIGGVLLRGQKGSAKTTLARGLARLLAADAPFVELPIGTTEDRLVGSIDLAAALTGGVVRFSPGLLAAAHGGGLYVDEVNLLPDHLVDVLLDVAVSGINRVEREGVSHTHPSRFVLIGSMNPEEGDLRPQLLDRFGLAADVLAPADPVERAEAVRRRMAFDADPAAFAGAWPEEPLAAKPPAALPDELVHTVSVLCASVGAEGLRADLVICRAAAALAGLEGRDTTTVDDVRRVAPLALAHRRRRQPFDDPGMAPDEIEQALQQATADTGPQDRVAEPDEAPERIARLEAPRAIAPGANGRRSMVEGQRGRLVGSREPSGTLQTVAVGPTVRAAAARRATYDEGPLVAAGDVREAVREQRAGNLIILAVDASGSMGAETRMEAAKGAVLGLLLDAYQRRDRVALVTFRDDGADVALRPTGSIEVAKARLTDLPTGGRTPLAAGIHAALALAQHPADRPLLVLLSDGRATAGPDGQDPLVAAKEAAAEVRRRKVPAVVVDAEDGPTRLGLAAELAEAMGARYLTLTQLSAASVRHLAPSD